MRSILHSGFMTDFAHRPAVGLVVGKPVSSFFTKTVAFEMFLASHRLQILLNSSHPFEA